MATLVFRVDASPLLATGHVMRCITLAQALMADLQKMANIEKISKAEQLTKVTTLTPSLAPTHNEKLPCAQSSTTDLFQHRVIFVSNMLPNNLIDRLTEHHIEYLPLPFDIDSKTWCQKEDAQTTLELLTQRLTASEQTPLTANKPTPLIDLLVVDHYLIDKQWQLILQPHYHKLLVIDDLANRAHIADFLLDQTLDRQPNDYLPFVTNTCQLLLGQKHILLRDEFIEQIATAKIQRQKQIQHILQTDKTADTTNSTNSSITTKPIIKHILVNMGGLDSDNITTEIIHALIQYQSLNNKSSAANTNQTIALTVTLIISSHSPHVQQIQTLIAQHSMFKLIIDCHKMADQMLLADLAIGACGTTAWERCSLGLPTLGIVLADNQQLVNKNLAKHKAIIDLGDKDKLTPSLIINAINFLNQHPKAYIELINQCFNICDGLGIARVINRITSPEVNLVKATKDDIAITFKWQSNQQIRQFSRQPNPVKLDEHTQWFTHSLTMPTRHLFIITCAGEKLGVLRLDEVNKKMPPVNDTSNANKPRLEISILVAPEAQGKHIALKALHQIPAMFDNAEIYAYVQPQNIASQRLFTQANFVKLSNDSYLRP